MLDGPDTGPAEHRYRPVLGATADEMADRLGDDSTGHDMDHAWRVFDLGVHIAEPVGADVEVVGAAALTHDVHRAMGAVGTVRTFAFGGVAGHRPRDPDGEEYSALDRFDEKLLQPREERHTAAARAFAEERHDSMAEFVERSREEWRGKL